MYRLWKDPEGKSVFVTKSGTARSRSQASQPFSQGDGGGGGGGGSDMKGDNSLESSQKRYSDIQVVNL